MASAANRGPVDFVSGGVLCELRDANVMVDAALCADFVAGRELCEACGADHEKAST